MVETSAMRAAAEEAPGAERFGYTQELRRRLSFADLLVYGLIFMVPIAPFAIFGNVFQASRGMPALAYVVGAVAMMFTANSYAQMAQAYPIAGSVYVYVGRGLAKPAGFVAGWMALLDYLLIPSLLYLASAMAMASLVPQIPVWAWLLLFVLLNTAVNSFGVQFTAFANKAMLCLEIIVLAVFLAVGAVALAQGRGNGLGFSALFDARAFSAPAVLGAVSIAALSFLGFDGISTLAEENSGTAKQLSRSMMGALLIAGTLFVAQVWLASQFVADPARLVRDGDPAGSAFYEVARSVGGQWLFILSAAATAVAWGFANALAAQAATSRLLYAMARDRRLPSFLGRVDPERGVPGNAILAVAVISLVVGLVLNSRPDGLALLSALVNFGALTAFAMLNVAVFWKFTVKERSQRWIVHGVAPLLGLVVICAVVVEAKPYAQIFGLLWLGLGAVVAILPVRSGRMADPSGAEEVQ